MLSKNVFTTEKIIPVIRENTFEKGLENSRLAIKSGLNVIEVTFTTPDAHKIVEQLVSETTEQTIGVGTIITAEQARVAIKAGTQFIVSPAFSKEVSDICKEADILYIPGAITPTEVVTASLEGWDMIKIFPGSLVGQGYIKGVKSVVPHVDFMVTGGVSPENLKDWLETPAQAFGLGSALFKGSAEDIAARIKTLKEVANA